MMRTNADDCTLIDDMDGGTILAALEAIMIQLNSEEQFQNGLRIKLHARHDGTGLIFPTFSLFRGSRERAGKLVKLQAMLKKLLDKKTSNSDSGFYWGADWE